MEAAQDQLAHFNRVLQRLHQADKDKLDLAIELSEARYVTFFALFLRKYLKFIQSIPCRRFVC